MALSSSAYCQAKYAILQDHFSTFRSENLCTRTPTSKVNDKDARSADACVFGYHTRVIFISTSLVRMIVSETACICGHVERNLRVYQVDEGSTLWCNVNA